MAHHKLHLNLGLALALSAGLAGCASPEARTPSSPPPVQTGVKAAASWEGVGLLTLKGNAPFSWWALQVDSGEVWRLELPSTLPGSALEARQNCKVQVSGHASGALLGTRLLQVSSVKGLQRPELGAPENQRCQFSLTAP